MTIDCSELLKLRLAVARFGESDNMAWWNTNGLLARAGASVLSRGFPVTYHFAQAKAVCAVATARCQALFAPTDCITLWNLPVEIEDSLDRAWLGWCRETHAWNEFFDRLETIKTGDLIDLLSQLGLINAATVEAAKGLRRSAEGKAVPLPGTGKADSATLMLLAAGFAKGERQKPAIPYIRLADA